MRKRFNEFFTNIGTKSPEKTNNGKQKNFDFFFKKRIPPGFTMGLVDNITTPRYTSSLASKNSPDHDDISRQLLTFLSSALINTLTLKINQSLVTRTFPMKEKEKIERVLPPFKSKAMLIAYPWGLICAYVTAKIVLWFIFNTVNGEKTHQSMYIVWNIIMWFIQWSKDHRLLNARINF